MWSLLDLVSFCIYGRASLAMEGKSVVPMEITFNGTVRSLSYIPINPCRYLNSSLGLPILFLRMAEREQ